MIRNNEVFANNQVSLWKIKNKFIIKNYILFMQILKNKYLKIIFFKTLSFHLKEW